MDYSFYDGFQLNGDGDRLYPVSYTHLDVYKRQILSNTDIMGSLNTPLAPIVNTITGLKATKFVLEKALKISRHRTLPKYSFGTFRSWYMKKMVESQQKFERKVAYYHGCYVNYNNPQLGKEFIQVFLSLIHIWVRTVRHTCHYELR